MQLKTCASCHAEKSLASFYARKKSPDGLSYLCKQCDKERSAAYRNQNRESLLAKKRAYNLKHKTVINEKKRLYNQSTREEKAIKDKLYYASHKAEKREYDRRYRALNRLKANERLRFKRKTDPQYRLAANLRTRLNKFFRGKTKSGSAVSDLGCSLGFLMQWLEEQFQPGMTWDNYGEGSYQWSLDHIKPLSSYDLTNRADFLAACHFTNLQPLWHIDNLRKSDNLIDSEFELAA